LRLTSLSLSLDHYGVYVLDTDGFVIDRVASGYSREYGFLTFANDHGLISRSSSSAGMAALQVPLSVPSR
jgi:hypothetical protein